MYKWLIRPLLFSVDAETIHHFVFKSLKLFHKFPGINAVSKSLFTLESKRLEKKLFGITFSNPVGLGGVFEEGIPIR